MFEKSFIFFVVLFSGFYSYGAIEDIFLNIDSPISSGQISKEKLNSGTYRIDSLRWYKVTPFQSPEKMGWIESKNIIDSLSLATLVTPTKSIEFRHKPRWTAGVQGQLPANISLKAIERQENWILVEYGGRSVWIDSTYVQIEDDDFGEGINLTPARLLNHPTAKKGPLIQKGQRFKVLRFYNKWLKIGFQNIQGYIPIKDTLTRLHFAEAVRTKDQRWHKVALITDKGIESTVGERISIRNITQIKSKKEMVYALFPHSKIFQAPRHQTKVIHQVPQWTPLQVFKTVDVRWGQSYISKHGKIWWPIDVRFGALEFKNAQKIFSKKKASPLLGPIGFADLYRKGLFDIAAQKTPQTRLVASANGIFKSDDGLNWNSIPQFKTQNYPVAIGKNGKMYVGPYVSNNGGKTFEPYIRWERVISVLSKNSKTMPPMKLQNINWQDDTLKISLVSKTESFELVSFDEGSHWSLKSRRKL